MSEYFEELIGEMPRSKSDMPSWAEPNKSSGNAYLAIIELKKEKELYIRGHGQSADYKKKKLYQINQTEVGDKIGITRNSLFNQNTFSGQLATFLDQTNEKLETAKIKRLEGPKKRGFQNRTKKQLQLELKEAVNEVNVLKERNSEALFGELLSAIPLDVRKKLGLKIR